MAAKIERHVPSSLPDEPTRSIAAADRRRAQAVGHCGSDLSDAAVDEQFGAIDKACIVGREEQGGVGDLFGPAHPADRDLRGKMVLDPLRLLAAAEHVRQADGLGWSGTDDVRADVAVLEVDDPAFELISTTDPPSFNSGSAFCTVKIVPFTLVSKVWRYCSSVMAPSGSIVPPPALATTTSICACCCWTAS